MIIFDYIFYRFVLIYYSFDGKRGITGQVTVGLIQALIILNPIAWYFLENYSSQERKTFIYEIETLVVVIMTPLFLFNGIRYRKRFDELHEKWKDESDSKKVIKLSLIILLILGLVLFTPILVSIKDYSL